MDVWTKPLRGRAFGSQLILDTRPRFEVADVFRLHAVSYGEAPGVFLSRQQRSVLRSIVQCRTAAFGGHVEECDYCLHQHIAYNSCRNRHCPKCLSLARARWLQEHKLDLLPVEYFHVVFTVPATIAAVALQNQSVVYNILFRTVGQTLKRIAADPKHLGAEIGYLAVLHTWGQNLSHHPHIHCVVPGEGVSPDGASWVSTRKGFFLPDRLERTCPLIPHSRPGHIGVHSMGGYFSKKTGQSSPI